MGMVSSVHFFAEASAEKRANEAAKVDFILAMMNKTRERKEVNG